LKFCPKCGSELEPDAAFCPSCGAQLEARKKIAQGTTDIVKSKPSTISQIKLGTEEYSTFIIRLIAIIIDSIVIGIVGAIISFIIFVPWIPFNPLGFWEGDWWIISFPFDWLLGFIYHWLLEAFNNGQTVGKMALKIRTVDEKTLDSATPGAYAINNIFKSSPFLILDLIIGVLKYSGDPKNRVRIMQHVSETVVISTK
jgi:uncharacterized RDD family membrane protein YckC